MVSSDDDSSDDELFAALSNAADGGAGGGGARSLFGGPSSAVESTVGAAVSSSIWSSSDEDDPLPCGDDDTLAGGRGATPKPKTVGAFIVGAKVGEGTYATVREGLNTDTLRIVAVKIVDMRRLRKVKGGIDSIKREIRVQKALKRNPHLIELLHVHEDAVHAKMYMFMEMATGCTLQELLDSAPGKKLPPSQVAFFLHQTFKGLNCMHGRGIVHRDIKPANLMINANSVLKIADFGVAEFLDQYTTDDNVTRTSGSPAFQAPEIANGEDGYSGMKVDVWAAGVSAYFLLVGCTPFRADTLVGLFSTIATGNYQEPIELGESVCDAIRQMLEVDWHLRASVDDMLKHSWIAQMERMPSLEEQANDGWLPVPKKIFSVLSLAQRLVEDDMSFPSPTSRGPASSGSLSSRPPLPRTTLSSMFEPPSDAEPTSASIAAAPVYTAPPAATVPASRVDIDDIFGPPILTRTTSESVNSQSLVLASVNASGPVLPVSRAAFDEVCGPSAVPPLTSTTEFSTAPGPLTSSTMAGPLMASLSASASTSGQPSIDESPTVADTADVRNILASPPVAAVSPVRSPLVVYSENHHAVRYINDLSSEDPSRTSIAWNGSRGTGKLLADPKRTQIASKIGITNAAATNTDKAEPPPAEDSWFANVGSSSSLCCIF
jgi:serine/threonine-protein kinase 11